MFRPRSVTLISIVWPSKASSTKYRRLSHYIHTMSLPSHNDILNPCSSDSESYFCMTIGNAGVIHNVTLWVVTYYYHAIPVSISACITYMIPSIWYFFSVVQHYLLPHTVFTMYHYSVHFTIILWDQVVTNAIPADITLVACSYIHYILAIYSCNTILRAISYLSNALVLYWRSIQIILYQYT